MATAHPAKFAEVKNLSWEGVDDKKFEKDVLPDELRVLASKEKRLNLIDEASVEKVKSAIIKALESA